MSDSCPRCGTPNATGRLGACPRCLLSEEDLPPVVVGGHLELFEEIGRGGMGSVFRARHLRLGRTVAVKFLPAELAREAEFRTRFEREARALALLNHPNIVAVHDFGQDGERSYIVMEYVEGASLAPQIPLALDRALDVAVQVCGALAYAHGQGVVHRDIKPENILLDASGRVKVTDFGIARIVRPGTSRWTVTTPDVVVGTPQYMAPEAMDGAPPDPRMDVYSIGVLLYQMVTGRLPVGSFDPLPGPADAVVRKALAPDPARRYATAGEMGRDLERARASGGPGPLGSARDKSLGSARDKLPADERLWVQAVAILQAISTAVALWAFLVSVKPRVIEEKDLLPLVSIGSERLPDGRIVSRARFETWPTLAALATFALAITAYGLLRRHWRRSGLERPGPDVPVRESWWVFAMGVAALLVYGVRRWLQAAGFTWAPVYIPLLGGVIEVAALYFLWMSILEAWRRSRPLRREPMLWFGLALALIPPVSELLAYLRTWRP